MSEGKHESPQEDVIDKTASSSKVMHLNDGLDDHLVSEGRRRFARAGLLAPPILMSVVSRPVIGGGVNCLSNALSGNLSNPDRGLCETPAIVDWKDATNWPLVSVMGCNGNVSIEPDSLANSTDLPNSCADCKDSNGDWDGTACGTGTPFKDVFCSSTDDRSMYRILCESTTGPNDEAAAVEMLLYSLKEPKYALRPMQVQDLYNGRDSTYQPFLSHFGGLSGYLTYTLFP